LVIIAPESRLAKPGKPLDIGTWLHGLGLGQYQAAFRDNDVDAEVLPELTAEDLISIGVTSVGHRRKLLAAIAALNPNHLLPTPARHPKSETRTPMPSGGS
jgi:hypothetical protein